MQAQHYVKTKEGTIYNVTDPDTWRDCERLKKTDGKRLYREQAIQNLRNLLKPGDTVYTVLRHVSSSGMSRDIDLYIFRDNRPRYLTQWAATALDWPMSKNSGIRVGGCGMDMGFHLVYSLSSVLYPHGFGIEGENSKKIKIRPDSKEKASELIKRGWKFRGRNGDPSGWDNSGGYALEHEWL